MPGLGHGRRDRCERVASRHCPRPGHQSSSWPIGQFGPVEAARARPTGIVSSTGCSVAASCRAPALARGRARRRQVHAAAGGRRSLSGPVVAGHSRFRGRVGGPGAAAGRADQRRSIPSSTWPPRTTLAPCSPTSTRLGPGLLVVDSVQTISNSAVDSGAGGVPQIRAVAAALIGSGQGAWHRHRARRPRHEGRWHRRPARAGTPRRRSTALRG